MLPKRREYMLERLDEIPDPHEVMLSVETRPGSQEGGKLMRLPADSMELRMERRREGGG